MVESVTRRQASVNLNYAMTKACQTKPHPLILVTYQINIPEKFYSTGEFHTIMINIKCHKCS